MRKNNKNENTVNTDGTLTMPERKNKTHFGRHNVFRIVFLCIIFAFCFLPLIFLLTNITKLDIGYVFKDRIFYLALKNSLLYSLAGSVLSVVLSLIAAYFLNFSNIKFKKLFVVLLTVPMLIPTLSIGLGIRVLEGANGFFSKIFGSGINLIGMSGLILGSAIIAFPPTFLVLYDALRYENKESYDAAEIMGINKFSAFFRITLPYLAKPLLIAFLACFTLVFSDYGVPMEVAGRVSTLPMYLYSQATESFKYGRAALIGIILLVPAIASFVIDTFFKDDNGQESASQKMKCSLLFNIISYTAVILILIFLFIPQLSFVSLAFMKGYPNNIAFSVDNLKNVFSTVYGVGLTRYIINSLLIAVLTGLVGTIFAYAAAYFTSRYDGVLGKILNFAAVSTIAIPGIVLGIGYIFLFKSTRGWFYGTIAILVTVNMFHFLGSPFIMAKNCLSKINKDYEVIGNTLGLSKAQILFRVLIPNSKGTLIEMFSYFFLNSMITISAVTFLSTYKTQPLSLLITTYERSGNYEMQAVISFLIFGINIICKGIFAGLDYVLVKRYEKRKEFEFMELNRYQFSLLSFIEKKGKGKYTQRLLSDELTVSLGTINKELNYAYECGYLAVNSKDEISITEKGLKALEPYKVRKAIILAAGFGSRLAPVTLNTPKPLVEVNGRRIIDTLIDALVSKGITNIVIVRGYKKEKFNVLLEKYPFIKFVDNDEYNVTNNISSVMKVLSFIDRCYICEADLLVDNPNLINKYEYASNYLGIKVEETDDWCFTKKGYYIDSYKMGGENCYQTVGISYWNEADSKKLREDVKKLYNSRAGKENFWDNAPLRAFKKDFKIEIRKCHKSDIVEIDNFSELVVLDSSYKDYPGHDEY